MAERKAVNKYYPPDWDPTKGSINKHVGQHPLRDRARKLGQGILIIRFEMPYNIWCGGCGSHIGMGVRYNAEKKKVGNYYSTPIYKFRMKCHLCDNHFEIQTDPKNHDYVILCGAKRKEQRWDPKQNEQVVPEDKATQKKLATDAMFKLEHGSDDQKKGKSVVSTLSQLEDRREQYKDDYILNKIAREKFRTEKKRIKEEKAVDTDLLKKSSLDIELVKETEEDIQLAGLLKYRTIESYDEKQLQKRKEIELRPIFQKPKGESESPTSKGGSAKNIKQKFASKLAVNQRSPFDNITTSKTEPGVVLTSLGVRRKRLIKPVSESSHENQPSSGPTTPEVVPMDEATMTSNICDVDGVSIVGDDHDYRTEDVGCNVDVVKQLSEITSVTLPSSSSKASGMGLGLVSVYSDSSSEESDVT